MAKPKLSIIIPVRQTAKERRDTTRLGNCLDSLAAQTAAGEFEIIISDTDSSPSYKKAHEETAKAHKAKYIYTKTGQVWNISRARNVGIRAAKADLVMVTDADCIYRPDFIETALKYAGPDSIVHCRIFDIPKEYEGPLNEWAALAGMSSLRPNWCYGGCQIVDRKWAASVHGYDEAYILWGAEDTDFMERACQAGKKNIWIENETSYFHQWHDQSNRTADVAQKSKNRERLKLTETKQLPIVRNPHAWGGQAEPDEWDDTAIIVTTFLRDASLVRTIQTIRKFYPLIDIIVADNGHPTPEKTAWMETYGCQYVTVPFDSGVTVTRNAGVRALSPRHKYAVIVEDDIGFSSQTDLSKWRTVLDAEPTVGVVGGLLRVITDYAGEYEQHYEATLEINADDRTAYLRKIDKPEWKTHGGTRYHFSDIVLNVFMARRAVLDGHPWDENIKSAPEHCDWFFGLKYRTPDLATRGVVFVPDVSLVHFKDVSALLDENYKAYRGRPGAFAYFGEKWDVDNYWNSWHPKWGIENPQLLRTYAEISTQTRKNVFTSAAKILDLMGVKWWLEAGTCLGAIREKNFIGHDPDIDVGVWTDNVRGVADDLIERMRRDNFTVAHEFEYQGELFELSFVKADVKIDVFFFFERNGLAWHGAFGPENENGTGEYNVFLPHVFTLSLFKDLREIDFVGLRVKVPNPPEQYLTERYGPNWQAPDKAYRYWTDCRAVARKFMNPEAATVYIGGVWDVFHHGHLNILERCKALGGKLIVGVLTDDGAAAYKSRPLIPEAERLRIIKSLRIVDEAIPQHAQDPTDDLRANDIKPDYLVHGDDWDFVPGGDYCRANGGMTIILPHTEGISSTLIKLGGDVRKMPRMVPAGGVEYAIGISTFMRERTMIRTVQAFQKNITEPFKLYVADDSGKKSDRKLAFFQDLRKHGAAILDKPFDVGLSAKRNAIVREVQEPFVLITDDDVCLDDNDALLKMRAVLDARPDIGLVAALIHNETGGAFSTENYVRGLRLEQVGGMLKRTPMGGAYEKAPMAGGGESLFLIADQIPNCMLCRREVFDSVKWDDRIKIEAEHISFFLDLRKAGKYKAAVAVEATATHFRSEPDLEYERYRRSYSWAYMKSRYGIDTIVNQF
jgi:glycerol-3-phosphate cytidylyltransferase